MVLSRLRTVLITTAFLALPSSASVLYLSLDSQVLSGLPGSSITFAGFLQNNSGFDVYLNGASDDLPYDELTFDPTPFFTLAPLVLADGDSYSGDLFSIAISDVAVPGDYFGSFFIQGGSDSVTFDVVSTVGFQVTVSPEPSSGRLLILGSCIYLAAWSRRRSVDK
jgi:hypothetical protein